MSFRTLSSVFAAFLAACLAPALLAFGFLAGFGIATGSRDSVPFGLAVAMGMFVAAAFHAVPLGVPVFAVGYWMRRITSRSCTILGAVIGVIPISVIQIAGRFPHPGDLPPTPAPFAIALVLLFAGCGGLGGWAFWMALKWLKALPAINRQAVPT
jgi:hypothetical protein